MFNKTKLKIKLYIMRQKWKKKNRNNFTYPKHYCDISKIDIGDFTYGGIDAESFGCTESHLTIGRFCSIAQNVRFILDGEHNYHKVSTYPFKVRLLGEKAEALCRGPIEIGDDVWIGERAIILSGVSIGRGAVIGAGSIVRNDVPPYAIYVNDCVKKYRFSPDIIEQLLKIDYSKLNKDNINLLTKELYEDVNKENVPEIVRRINGDTK